MQYPPSYDQYAPSGTCEWKGDSVREYLTQSPSPLSLTMSGKEELCAGGDDLSSIVGGVLAHYAPPVVYVVDRLCDQEGSVIPEYVSSTSEIVAVCSSPAAAKRALLRAIWRGAHGRYLKVRLREGWVGLENMCEDVAAQFEKCSQRCSASAAAAAGCEACGEAAFGTARRAYLRAEPGAERFFDFDLVAKDSSSEGTSSNESDDDNPIKHLRKSWRELWHEDGTGNVVITDCVMYFSGEVWDEVSTWTITRVPRTR